MRSHTPVRHLVSRHTRELLRRYHSQGLLATPVAERRVEDRLVEMTAGERALYDAVEDYIASTYNQAAAAERTAVGFVMTIYRRRLASSFQALRTTLQRHLDVVAEAGDAPSGEGAGDLSAALFGGLDEDVSDDETSEEARDADEVALLEQRALAVEEAADIRMLLDGIGVLPPDSKLRELKNVIRVAELCPRSPLYATARSSSKQLDARVDPAGRSAPLGLACSYMVYRGPPQTGPGRAIRSRVDSRLQPMGMVVRKVEEGPACGRTMLDESCSPTATGGGNTRRTATWSGCPAGRDRSHRTGREAPRVTAAGGGGDR